MWLPPPQKTPCMKWHENVTSSGSLEHSCHTSSLTPTHPPQHLYLDLLCDSVQHTVFMNVVQMVTSHCQVQCLHSPPVPWWGSSGISCRQQREMRREEGQAHHITSTDEILADALNYHAISYILLSSIVSLCKMCSYWPQSSSHVMMMYIQQAHSFCLYRFLHH